MRLTSSLAREGLLARTTKITPKTIPSAMIIKGMLFTKEDCRRMVFSCFAEASSSTVLWGNEENEGGK